LREVIVKIGLKQEEEKEEIVVKALLDSRAMRLVMSKEFARKYKFRRTKLEKPIYIKNIDRMLNYVRPIIDTMEIDLVFKEHKKRISVDVIRGQSWGVILEILWLACYNLEIDWRI